MGAHELSVHVADDHERRVQLQHRVVEHQLQQVESSLRSLASLAAHLLARPQRDRRDFGGGQPGGLRVARVFAEAAGDRLHLLLGAPSGCPLLCGRFALPLRR